MKKSVIILIAIIYLASVALVSFYGLQPKMFDEVVYVDSIEFLNDDIRLKDDGATRWNTALTPTTQRIKRWITPSFPPTPTSRSMKKRVLLPLPSAAWSPSCSRPVMALTYRSSLKFGQDNSQSHTYEIA